MQAGTSIFFTARGKLSSYGVYRIQWKACCVFDFPLRSIMMPKVSVPLLQIVLHTYTAKCERDLNVLLAIKVLKIEEEIEINLFKILFKISLLFSSAKYELLHNPRFIYYTHTHMRTCTYIYRMYKLCALLLSSIVSRKSNGLGKAEEFKLTMNSCYLHF